MPGPFVHLHCHSHYSLLDGASRIPELVSRAKEQGMNALALTDHGNLYGAIEFYRECKAAGLNPILGYEAYIAPGKRTEREARRRGEAGFHLTLLARDRVGFRNLVKMASIAFLEGYHYVPRIDKELLAAHKEGIICLSGCASAEFSDFILKEQLDEALGLAKWFHQLFGKHFYIEIQNNGLDLQRRCAQGAIDVAQRLGLPLVATSDAHYLCQADHLAHDVLLCINTGKTRNDANRLRYGSDQFYVRAANEMYQLFPEHTDAVRRSQEIADGCAIDLDFKTRHFPAFTPPGKQKPEAYLRELCEQGLQERYGGNAPQAAVDRLHLELDIICRMGFASYFLIVWDFVRFAREHNIPASARGSACGAVVSYVLRLSHVDPLEYDLLFERFLDPNRSEAPDIDIDFCQEGREQVIAYVRQKYGEASVAQIATFGTLAARAAVKDVGRALDVPLDRVNQLTNMIPKTLGITLDDALKQSTDLRSEYETDPTIRELIDIARKLEGTNRNVGTHAAGVVIANGPITDYVPLQRVIRKSDDAGSKRDEAVVTTQWVMGDLEKVGMLKMDFLGLRTLTLLNNAVLLIEKTRGEKIDLYNLPLDDPETYVLLQRGDARGVFQFESDGIRELLKRLRPDNIRDIIACTALYRPGPLGGGMVDAYINRKHGREKPVYEHPIMAEVLSETYGVMCIHEDARVALADGSERPIKAIRRGDLVLALNRASHRFESKECHGCGPTRRCGGLRITLENGFRVTLTDDHQVLTDDGFKEAQHLDTATDLVASALHLPVEEAASLVGASRRLVEITSASLSPLYSGERGWGEGAEFSRASTPSPPTPLPRVQGRGGLSLGDVRYCRIQSIERVTDQQFYGMSVADHHNLVANGIVVKNCYQEQVMRILNILGGIELSSAYACIKAISKKKQETIDQRRAEFIKGAVQRGAGENTAKDIFDLITFFGGYGFNKSHSAAYALVSYQTAYLKAHYRPEFMAALLSSEVEDGNKRDILVEHVADARRLGVEVLPPDVNAGDVEFTVARGKILFGLIAIKGLGRGAAGDIVAARQTAGPFKDIFDFCERIDLRVVSKAAIEKMIKAGALDCFGTRAQLMHVLARALQAAAERQQDRKQGQLSLFESATAEAAEARVSEALPDIPEWSDSEKLKNEKEALDFYFSSHPLAQHEDDIQHFRTHTVEQLADLGPNQEVVLGGMLTQLRFMNTKKARNGNSRYVRCKLEDFTGAVECVMWPDDFVRYKDEVQEDRVCFIKGTVERNREEPGLVLTRILSIEQAQRELTKGLWLLLSLGANTDQDIDAIARVLKRTPGPCPVYLTVKDAAGKKASLKLGEDFRINPATFPMGEMETILGKDTVKFAGALNGNGRNGK